MAASNDVIFSRAGSLTNNNTTGMNQPITAAANDYTGAGANNVLAFTAGVEGSYIQRLRLKAVSTNVATVMRVFINNGSANTTAANNTFYGEINLPATTASASSPTPDIDYPLNFALDPSFRIYVGLGTGVAGGWVVQPIAGKY